MKTNAFAIPLCLFLAWGVAGCSKKKAAAPAMPPTSQVIGTDATNEAVTIKARLIVGKKYGFRIEAVQAMDVTVGDLIQPTKTVMALNHEYSVSVPRQFTDGGQELDLEMTGQKFFYQNSDKGFLSFDSREKPSADSHDTVAPLLRKLLGVPIRCFMGADGKMLRAEGFNALVARLDKGDVGMKAAIQSTFTEENLKTLFDHVADLQPADPVKVGGSWPVRFELEVPGTSGVEVKAQCQLVDWEWQCERQCVRIDYKGEIGLKPDGAADASLAKIENGTISGTAWFDPALGMVINSSSEGHVTVQATALGQTMSTRANFTANLRLVSVEGL